MVVHDFDFYRAVFGPGESDAPLAVYPNRVLAGTISPQDFQPIPGRKPKIVKHLGIVERREHGARPLDKIGRKSLSKVALHGSCGKFSSSADDHDIV